MRTRLAVIAFVLAASVGIAGAFLQRGSEWGQDDPENAGRSLQIQVVAVPPSLDGEKVTSAALSGNGLLALGTDAGRVSIVDGNLRAWRGGWERRIGPHAISRLAFSPDGVALAGAAEGALLVWRLDTQETNVIPVRGSPTAIALSPGARWLAMTYFDVFVIDVARGQLFAEFNQDMRAEGNGVYEAVAFTPDSTKVVAASEGNIDAWSLETRRRAQPPWSCECGADGSALSRDASLAVFGTADAHVLLWDVALAKPLKDKTISVLHGDHVYGTAVSFKGTRVLAGTASGWFVVWDPGSNAVLGRVQPSGQPISHIESSDDGRLILVKGQKAEYEPGVYDLWLVTLTGGS